VIETVVLATNFSAESEAAFGYVSDLAPRLGATIVVVHVVDDVRAVSLFGGITTSTSEVREALRAASQALDPLAEQLRAAGATTFTRVIVGPVAEMILAVCRGVRADLLVLGARPSGSLQDLFVSSISRSLVSEMRMALLLVPAARNR
jgi:nucleotide-binding universal stress UspA family protein